MIYRGEMGLLDMDYDLCVGLFTFEGAELTMELCESLTESINLPRMHYIHHFK